MSLMKLLAPYKLRVALAVFIGFLTVAANIGLMATSAYLIASAALHPLSILMLWVPIVGVRFFGLTRAIFRYLERLVSHDTTFRILARVRVDLYERLERVPPVRLVMKRSGDILSTVVADVDTLQNFFVRVAAPSWVWVLIWIVSSVFLGMFQLSFAWIMASFFLVGGVAVPALAHVLGRRHGRAIVAARAELFARLVDMTQGMTELVMFGQQEAYAQSLFEVHTRLIQRQNRMGFYQGMVDGLTLLISHACMWVLLWMAIVLVQHHTLPGVDLGVVILAALASFEAVIPLPQAFAFHEQSRAALSRLNHVTGQNLELVASKNPILLVPHFDLEVRDMHMCYDEEWVLHGVDFDLPFGKHLAIVGSSGAGKTTIAQVLLRFCDYQKGSVRLGGHELSRYDEDVVRSSITLVEQQSHIFTATVAENLQIARPDASILELEEALAAVQLDDDIRHLPQGLGTLMGELGTSLSGGQAQRLGLARAVLRAAPISIFDEPTTGLDSITETAVTRALLSSLKGQSVIWITHRLANLENMDEILVLKDGRVVERGTHASLMACDSWYRQMYALHM